MTGLITLFMRKSMATRITATKSVIFQSLYSSTSTRKMKTMISLVICRIVRISANTLLMSDVMFLWMTAVSAPR